MSKDQTIGGLLLIGSIVVIAIYGWMIFADFPSPTPLWWWAFFIVASIAVVAIMGLVAWIGYTIATTPPPGPLELEEESEPQEAE